MEKTTTFNIPLDLQLFAEDDPNETPLTEDDFIDEEEEEKNNPKSKETKEEEQSRKKNAEEARKRREREQKEREEKIRKEAFEEGKRLAKRESLKINEFTDEPIETDLDAEVFETMKAIKEKGGDPIKDFVKEWAKKENSRRKEEADKAKARSEQEEWEKQDRIEFSKKVGGSAKALEIFNDSKFRLFAKGRIGKDKLVDIYEEFLDFEKGYKPNDDRSKSLTPNSTGGTAKPKDIRDMTAEEFQAYWNKKYNS